MALSDFDVRSLEELFEQWGYPRANAGRLLRRYYNCGGEGLDGTVVSPMLASRLVKEIGLRSTSVITRREATDGTIKLLVGLPGRVPSSEGKVPRGLSIHSELGTRQVELTMPPHDANRSSTGFPRHGRSARRAFCSSQRIA